MTVIPNNYTFLDFTLLADGRRYRRVWDASAYPSLNTYVDGKKVAHDPFPYNPQEALNRTQINFHLHATAGITPYSVGASLLFHSTDESVLSRYPRV